MDEYAQDTLIPADALYPGSPRQTVLDALKSVGAGGEVTADDVIIPADAAAGQVPVSVADVVGEVIDVKRYGAIGDGTARLVTPQQLASAVALGFTGDHHLDDFDAFDTQDWLGIQLAIKAAEAAGGQEVLLPPGHYRIRRPIVGRPHVRVVTHGLGSVQIGNDYAGEGGWASEYRKMGLMVGVTNPTMFNTGVAQGLPHDAIVNSGKVYAGQTIIPFQAPGTYLNYSVGQFVWLRTGGETAGTASIIIPHRAFPNRVIEVLSASNAIRVELPVPESMLPVSPVVKVCPLGAIIDITTDAPWHMVDDFHIDGIVWNVDRFTARNGWYHGSCTNHRIIGREGIGGNGLYKVRWENIHMECEARAIEVKGCSYGVRLNNIYARQTATTLQTEPMISIGEGSYDIKIKELDIDENTFAAPEKVRLPGAFEVDIEGMRYAASGVGVIMSPAGAVAAQKNILTGRNWKLIAKDANVDRYVRVNGARVSVGISDVECSGPVDIPGGSFTFEACDGGWYSNLRLNEGYTPTGVALTSLSYLENIAGATAANLALTAAWINTTYALVGRHALDTTNGKLYWRTSAGKWRPFADQSGGADITPV